MSFCPSSFESSRNNKTYPIHFPNQSPLSFQTQQYQSNEFFSRVNPPNQQSFPSTQVHCRPTNISDKNKTGNNSTQTSSLTYRLLNALSSIYKPFSPPTNDKCLPFVHELFQDMINHYTITIEEVQNEIDYLSNKIPKNSC